MGVSRQGEQFWKPLFLCLVQSLHLHRAGLGQVSSTLPKPTHEPQLSANPLHLLARKFISPSGSGSEFNPPPSPCPQWLLQAEPTATNHSGYFIYLYCICHSSFPWLIPRYRLQPTSGFKNCHEHCCCTLVHFKHAPSTARVAQFVKSGLILSAELTSFITTALSQFIRLISTSYLCREEEMPQKAG